MPICHLNGCGHYKDPCSVYGYSGMRLRVRLGYCPRFDQYFDAETQEAYVATKTKKGRVRAGQQKQKGR
jgi:hypothetical protein